MEIRQLRYFVNAAKTLSFTEAARRSNVAQSTLSQQIKQLENELDVTLFYREGKHIRLTTEGRVLLDDALKILEDARQGLQRLADLRELQGGNVAVALASGLGISGVLTDVLTEYNKLYPKVTLTLHQVAAPLIPNLLRRHVVDLAITFLPHDIDDDLQAAQLFGTHVCATVCEHHPLDGRQQVSIEQLSHHPLVLPSHNLYVRTAIDRTAKKQGLTLQPAVEIDDLSHIIYMVRGGRWVSLLPDVATLAVRGLSRVPLDTPIPVPTSVITLAEGYQRKAVTEFLRLLSRTVRLLTQLGNETCDICGETFIT